jgi:hypothetical protein
MVEVHYDNQTCRRPPRKCFREESSPELSAVQYSKLLEEMSARTRKNIVRRMVKLVSEITSVSSPRTRVVISTGLEDEYSDKAFRNLVRVMRSKWDGEMVRSIAGDRNHGPIRTEFIELHSERALFPKGVPCIFNQDGLDGGAPRARELFEKFGGCEVLISWTKRAQGIGKVFAPPLSRSFAITDSDLIAHGALLLPPPITAESR